MSAGAAGSGTASAGWRPVVVLAGPTGCGKSALALDLAARTPAVVINADALQVYAELRILTARPGPAECARVPHRLYGVLGARERCSAGRWLGLACAVIEEAWAAGRLPIVVGGTGLYLRALIEGLSAIPAIPEAVRAEIAALAAAAGTDGLRAALACSDPDYGDLVATLDRQRLMRALEVVRATGRSLRWWQRHAPPRPRLEARFLRVVLLPPAAVLGPRLDARFEAMIAAGALDEVRALVGLGLDPGLPAMKAVGVGELRAYLEGEARLDAALERAKRNTRMLARRQRTWFRHQLRAELAVADVYSADLGDRLAAVIKGSVLTPSA